MRWTNQSHPQTLQIGVFLLYFDAVLSVLNGRLASGLGFILAAGAVGGAIGIANDKRIGWYVAVAVSAIIPMLLVRVLIRDGIGTLFDIDFMLFAVFPIAQLAALVHPMSRNYVKIWFEK